MRSAQIFSRIATTRIGTRWWVHRVVDPARQEGSLACIEESPRRCSSGTSWSWCEIFVLPSVFETGTGMDRPGTASITQQGCPVAVDATGFALWAQVGRHGFWAFVSADGAAPLDGGTHYLQQMHYLHYL